MIQTLWNGTEGIAKGWRIERRNTGTEFALTVIISPDGQNRQPQFDKIPAAVRKAFKVLKV